MSKPEFVCYYCGLTYSRPTKKCYCGESYSVVRYKPGMMVVKNKLRSASDLEKQPFSHKEIKGFEFFGPLPDKWLGMIFGPPGSGKSTFALKLIKAIAESKPNKMALFWAAEEGYDDSFCQKLRESQTNQPNIYVYSNGGFKDLLEKIAKYRPVYLCIDSINEADLSGNEIKELKRISYFPVLLTCQIRKDGKYKGKSDMPHTTDINIRTEEGIATTTKNRWCKLGTMKIFD